MEALDLMQANRGYFRMARFHGHLEIMAGTLLLLEHRRYQPVAAVGAPTRAGLALAGDEASGGRHRHQASGKLSHPRHPIVAPRPAAPEPTKQCATVGGDVSSQLRETVERAPRMRLSLFATDMCGEARTRSLITREVTPACAYHAEVYVQDLLLVATPLPVSRELPGSVGQRREHGGPPDRPQDGESGRLGW